MLSLSRLPHETLVFFTLDGKITIRFDEMSNKQVRFTVDAPRMVKILRDESLARQIASLATG